MSESLVLHARKEQIKRIWGIAKKGLQMTDEDLYCACFEVTGSDSISGLEYNQANRLITHLQALVLRGDRRAKYADKKAGTVRLSSYQRTPDQDALIEDLLSKINAGRYKVNIESLCARMFRKEPSKLTRSQAQAIIQALKSILSRES